MAKRPKSSAELHLEQARHLRALAKIAEELAAREVAGVPANVTSSLSTEDVVALALEGAELRQTTRRAG